MRARIMVLAGLLGGAAATAWAGDSGLTRAPIELSASSQAFANQLAGRYGVGETYDAVKADIEANGFRCEPYPPQAAVADAPTHECVKSIAEGGCNREYAIELRAREGLTRAPARASVAEMCLGALLPGKPR